jgi:hypothetical protein
MICISKVDTTDITIEALVITNVVMGEFLGLLPIVIQFGNRAILKYTKDRVCK